jgi:cytochrome P450
VTPTLFQQVLEYANRADPYPLYAEMRRTPVSIEDDGTVIVSTYREAAQLLHDPRISSDERQPVPPAPALARPDLVLESLRPRMAERATQLIDAQRGQRQIDMVSSFASPLPVAIICDLLDLPRTDTDRLHQWSEAIVERLDTASLNCARDRRVVEAADQMDDYLRPIIVERRQHPGHDLLSALVAPAGQGLTDAQAVSTATILLIAGHETIVKLIANGILTLVRQPGLIDRLRRDRKLMFSAIEEVLRYESPVQFRPRTTLANVDIGGLTIPSGAPVMLMLASANRDEVRFTHADRFIPDRVDNQHLAFASGVHYCLGAPLARLEAEIALREFVTRLDRPALLVDPPPYGHNAAVRGPSALPIEVQRVRDAPGARAA